MVPDSSSSPGEFGSDLGCSAAEAPPEVGLRRRTVLQRIETAPDLLGSVERRAAVRVVDDPLLLVLAAPVGAEVLDGLVEGVGRGVELGAVLGATAGDVGELSAAAVGEDVGALVGGALGAVDGEGVAV